MRFKYKIVALFYFLIALLPSVYAQPFNFRGSFANSIENIFRIFFRDFLGRDYIMLGITFIAFFLIVYSIFLAASKRIKIFQGEKGVNNQGIAFSIGFSLLSTFGIFYNYRSNIFETVIRIYEVASILALVLIGLVVYFLVYYGTRQGDKGNTCLALLAAGLAFYLMAWIIDSSYYMWIGFIVLIIGIVCLIFRGLGFKGFGSSGGGSGGSGGGGSGSNPKEKRTDVQVHVTDGTGNNRIGAVVEAKHRYRGWRYKGVTNANGLCNFRMKSGMRSIRATHNGVTGGGRFNLIPNMVNNCPIILGAGPGGSGRIYGTVTDNNAPPNLLQGVRVEWGSLGYTTNARGEYNIPVPVANFGTHNLTLTDAFHTQNGLIPVTISTASPNDSRNIPMIRLTNIDVRIEYTYTNLGITSQVLIPNQTNVSVRIISTGSDFTSPSPLNRLLFYDVGNNVILAFTEPQLVLNAPTEYHLNNINTNNVAYRRYFFH
jgi:hypothetical protein